jgi:hypothetical protein
MFLLVSYLPKAKTLENEFAVSRHILGVEKASMRSMMAG